MKYIQNILKATSIFIMCLFIMTPHIAVAATDASKEALCGGAGLVGGSDSCAAPAGSSSVETVIKRSINVFSAIIGIVAVVMIMVGGLKYITSQGDATSTASAKNTILYAAIGLVVVALAQVIVRFVLDRFA
jgi:hypothetical protein